jgi:hypothetical protein
VRPKVASFFILTPIPGTEQYDAYRKAGWITEQNLDRFDATSLTWLHPHLSPSQLEDLLYYCYVNYHGFVLRSGGLSDDDRGIAIFNRYTAASRMHPMAGGIDLLRLDTLTDYAPMRRSLYDIDLAPLPDNLVLSAHDESLNRRTDWRPKRTVESIST